MDHHPVIVTIRDDKDYIRVLLCFYDTTTTGWGVLLCEHWRISALAKLQASQHEDHDDGFSLDIPGVYLHSLKNAWKVEASCMDLTLSPEPYSVDGKGGGFTTAVAVQYEAIYEQAQCNRKSKKSTDQMHRLKSLFC